MYHRYIHRNMFLWGHLKMTLPQKRPFSHLPPSLVTMKTIEFAILNNRSHRFLGILLTSLPPSLGDVIFGRHLTYLFISRLLRTKSFDNRLICVVNRRPTIWTVSSKWKSNSELKKYDDISFPFAFRIEFRSPWRWAKIFPNFGKLVGKLRTILKNGLHFSHCR